MRHGRGKTFHIAVLRLFVRLKWIPFLFLPGLLLLWPAAAMPGENERIINFQSRIEIDQNGEMMVVEQITTVSTGGICRDFPTTYRTFDGRRVRVDFTVLSVWKNENLEPYYVESQADRKRVYIGRQNVSLRPERSTYTICYRTDRHIRFFKDHDELYWNVTGNDRRLPIESARATVILPENARVIDTIAYTGPQGSRGSDFSQSHDEDGNVVFTTTRPLEPKEGLSIALAWPKGVVTEPTRTQQIINTFRDQPTAVAGLTGLIVLSVYCLAVWRRVGRNPAKGPAIPRFHPPTAVSPAAARYLRKMRFDKKSFAAALVDMAAKGALTITSDDDVFVLKKSPSFDRRLLSRGEQRTVDKLFQKEETLRLESENHAQVNAAIKALKTTLETDLEKIYFRRNTRYLFPGIGIVIITLLMISLNTENIIFAGFIGIWISGWTFACLFLGMQVVIIWREGEFAGKIISTLFALPFYISEISIVSLFIKAVSLWAGVFFFGQILLMLLFYHLLKAPTLYGRHILDEIEGFRQYLTIAETERLQVLNSPDTTPALFEKYLPYAIALDVEGEWGRQFSEVFAGSGYRADWYSLELDETLAEDGLTDSLGQGLAGAVSSAAAAPGSSSGFGDGGSAGGGSGGW